VMRLSRTFAARLSAFSEVEALLREFALDAGLCHEDSMRLLLIVEELFTNTVRHGHGGDCDAPVDVTLGAAAAHLELAYEDTAPQYDPLEAARQADVSSPLEHPADHSRAARPDSSVRTRPGRTSCSKCSKWWDSR